MSGPLPPLVVVMGVSGVGKTAVGRILADRLGVAYVDADDLHPPGNVEAMSAGRALSEDQRRPWLLAVAGWLRDHDADGGVASCSALRRSHRDLLRTGSARMRFLHLTGDPRLIRERMGAREHFMPTSLLESQLETLEPPGDDEEHVTLDVTAGPHEIVQAFLARSPGAPAPPGDRNGAPRR